MIYLTEIQQRLVSELNDNLPYRIKILTENDEIFTITAAGLVSHKEKVLYWRPKHTPAHATTILLHEVCHVTMLIFDRLQDLDYNREEVLAEATARAVMKYLRLDTAQSNSLSQRYIDMYAGGLKEGDYQWIQKHLKLAMNHILKMWLPKFTAAQKKVQVAA